MIINIGSTNPIKIKAVKETVKNYEFLKNAKIYPINVKSEVYSQPKSLEETIAGAKNRAKNSFKNCNYSVGIESGLIEINEDNTKYMNFCVCAIYNGTKFALGFSPAFPLPKSFSGFLEKGLELDIIAYRTKQTKHQNLGHKESGIIGIWSKGKITRKMYTRYALQMALINLQNPKLFEYN